jgi:hypothetical protein
LKDFGGSGRILKKWEGRTWKGFLWLGIGRSGGFLKMVMCVTVPKNAGNIFAV